MNVPKSLRQPRRSAGPRPSVTKRRDVVLFVQHVPWDTSRAPAGKTTAGAYCHVPAGSTVDMTDRIKAQVERFAPGFRDLILARATHLPAQMEAYDVNYVGGDINGGIQDIRRLIFRPWPSLDPYRVGDVLYLCSSSTPPGGGVHGDHHVHPALPGRPHRAFGDPDPIVARDRE